MTPRAFADKYLQPYRVKNGEAVPELCPYCQGGSKKDKHTFALNLDSGAFNCLRGNCGKVGSFRQLLADFGELQIAPELRPQQSKNFTQPKTQPMQGPAVKVEAYFAERGISKATWQRRGVFEHEGNVAMPYYERGQLVLMKFRPARKIKDGERKSWRESGGKAVFWGMDDCDPSLPLLIVEGEPDALACDEAGMRNVVSVPSGNSDLTCVDTCWDWLNQFRVIVIWPDNDEPGWQMCERLIKRLGAWRCSIVYAEHKDANEMLLREGKSAVMHAIESAKPVPMQGLIRLADVEVFDPEKQDRVLSGITGLDQAVGGFVMGQVSVWTGINGSGKSTLIGQTLLDAIEQGYTVCAYSGELPAGLFRYWIELQAAGPGHIDMVLDRKTGRYNPRVERQVMPAIRNWHRDQFFLYDQFGSGGETKLLEVFDYAARRYDCKVFLIDNLMTTITAGSESDYYRRQSEFVGQMIDFAHLHHVHVHLVAHPRKVDGRPTKMDVAGTGDITNRADNVFSVHRIRDGEREKIEPELKNCDALIDLHKSRLTGMQNKTIGLMFETNSKRFYMPSDPGGKMRRYGWQNRMPGMQLGVIA